MFFPIIFYTEEIKLGLSKSSPSTRLYLKVLVTIPWSNLKKFSISNLLCYISFCFAYSSVFFSYKVNKLPLAFHQFLLTWKVDKFNKYILFEHLLYGFTQNTEYITLYKQSYLNYLYLLNIFYAFSYIILHCLVFAKILKTSKYIIQLIFTFLLPVCDGQSPF